jgi:hypothetical protein
MTRFRWRRGWIGVLILFWLGTLVACEGTVSRDTIPPRIKANQVLQLREHVGREVTVYGRVIRTSVSSGSKHHFLNFEGDGLSVICFAEDVDQFHGGGPAELFKNQEVELTGTVAVYREKLQIKLRQPSQIRILRSGQASSQTSDHPPSTAAGGLPAGQLKKIGPDSWLSPAGLKYQGRDPEGLTRIEHVLRHARDIPDRDGPHGVFDGGEARVFAVIDEAWKLAQKQGIRPDVERDRSLYLIPMGRRVGYLGGRAGAARGKPSLSRVFLVIETRSNNVITAYPR